MGDGQDEDAYLNRQPHFRDYQRFFVYENGVHFINTYRYLASEIRDAYKAVYESAAKNAPCRAALV